ncbi:MAG: RHS repeat-associated core domain-containing protein, partial [Verrucomicrobia bacterium]|nr:RHS repeat-associated core domain-containing protein [Verrucomicrobiota bacterium]
KKDDEEFSINALNQTGELSYDKDGNPSFLQDRKLSYDAFDRLISIEDSHTRTVYSYDALHRRISKKVYLLDGRYSLVSEIYYLYDGQNEIGAFDSSGLSLELRILGETPYAELGSAIALELYGKIYVPFYDLQGNMAALYSLDDNTLEEYCYTAFGEELFLPPLSQNPWRFASKRIDPETGLIFYGRRYYLPEKGRWLTSDPLGFQAGPNLYAFVFNSPLTHMDLYGLLAMFANGFREEKCNGEFVSMSVGTDHPDFCFMFSSGIKTSPIESLGYSEMLKEYTRGIKVTRMDNLSINFAKDLGNAIYELGGAHSPSAKKLRQDCMDFARINSETDNKIFLTNHSAGSIPVYNTIENLPEYIRKKIIVLNIAPAKVIPRRMCFDSYNCATKWDPVPLLGFLARIVFAGCRAADLTRSGPDGPSMTEMYGPMHLLPDINREVKDFNEIVWLDRLPKAPLHQFDSDTFKEVLQR